VISLHFQGTGSLIGATQVDLQRFAGYDRIRQIERESIRVFMERHRSYLRGRVLDYGAGKPGTCRQPQPYRDLVDGEYVPFDVDEDLPGGEFDTVICTQVLQYVESPIESLLDMHDALKVGGHLVLTYATNWDEVEDADKWRFTGPGIKNLLIRTEFNIVHVERRAEVVINNFRFPLGYGVVARRM
jgi:SAM-dependent methyltransferase